VKKETPTKRSNVKYFIIVLVPIVMISALFQFKNFFFAENMFLKYTSIPAGPCASHEYFSTHIEFYSNGTVHIYCDEFNLALSNDYPTKELLLSEDQILDLKGAIAKKAIILLPRDISSDSCDGNYDRLTTYTIVGEFTTGGLNVYQPSYAAVVDLIYGMVGADFIQLQNQVKVIQNEEFNKR